MGGGDGVRAWRSLRRNRQYRAAWLRLRPPPGLAVRAPFAVRLQTAADLSGDGALVLKIERHGTVVQVRLRNGGAFPDEGGLSLLREVVRIEDLFGREEVAAHWSPGGWILSRVRRRLARARKLAASGYRDIAAGRPVKA